MTDTQVERKPKPTPGERSFKDQLKEVKEKVVQDLASDDPIFKARKLVADNYNDNRNTAKMPMLTPELVDILWFTGTKANWRATAESSIVHGIRYEVTYNAQRQEAFINVFRKINNVKVEGV